MAKRKQKPGDLLSMDGKDYDGLVTGLSGLLDQARTATARVVNGVMTATYYELGRRIVEFEQGGRERAEYGEGLLKRLAADLTVRFGRGFGWRNLFSMRLFYLEWQICQTPSGISQVRAKLDEPGKLQTVSAISHRAAKRTRTSRRHRASEALDRSNSPIAQVKCDRWRGGSGSCTPASLSIEGVSLNNGYRQMLADWMELPWLVSSNTSRSKMSLRRTPGWGST